MRRSVRFATCTLATLLASLSAGTHADVVRLTGGGEVRGTLLEQTIVRKPSPDFDRSADEPILIRTLAGAVVEIDRVSVDFVKRRSQLVEEYISRSRLVEPTVQGHWQLAEWCRKRRLKNERVEQLEQILAIDPEHADARRLLDYVKHHGQWMTRDDMMQQRGYVKYNNRWVTTQELALLEKNASQRAAEQAWYPKVRLWLNWVTGANPQRQLDGIEEFRRLDDPDSIPALARFLGDHDSAAVRQLYVRTLANMPGTFGVQAILDRYLFDPADAVWTTALLSIRQEHHSVAVPMLISALTNDSNLVVRRAAAALGDIGSEEAVPALIAALITTHQFQVTVSAAQPITFSQTSDGRIGMGNPLTATGGMGAELAAMARLGQLPYGARVVPFQNVPRRTQTVTLRADVKNPEVLAALEEITGKSFGFNERDWHLWWSVSQG